MNDPEREARFGGAVRALRTGSGPQAYDRVLRLGGPVLVPLGALGILLAWWGAANTTRLFLQIPYLISGGLLGLGCMFVGGFVYFARFQRDLLAEARRESAAADARTDRTIAALEALQASLQPRPAPSRHSGTLVATAKGSLVHDADCPLVAGRPTSVLTAARAASREPCGVCRPDLAPGRAAP